jgi:DnaK suppressor protein
MRGKSDRERFILGIRESMLAKISELSLKPRVVSSGDQEVADFAEAAHNSHLNDLQIKVNGNRAEVVRHLQNAVRRIDKGTYGACDHCENEIPLARLKAIPWAQRCVPCQELSAGETRTRNFQTLSA